MFQRHHKSGKSIHDSDFDEPNYYKQEKFLDYEEWQNIPENKRPWYEYNHSLNDRKEISTIQKMIIPCIEEIVASGLTSRQKQIVTMYFLLNQTQVFIAKKLGISQPTVSQHLNGKKRKGKKVGGSIKKIRKKIHKMSSTQHKANFNGSHILDTLTQLLEEKSLRRSYTLLQNIIK